MKNILVTTALSSFFTELLISINKITFKVESVYLFMSICKLIVVIPCWQSIKFDSLVHVQILDSLPDYLNSYSLFFPGFFQLLKTPMRFTEPINASHASQIVLRPNG